LQFGDNDQLSSMVSSMAEADLLILLSDIDGLHEKPPTDGDSPVIPTVTDINDDIESLAGISQSQVGKGGMASKLGAAKRATSFGAHVILANGRESDILTRICSGDNVGTWFQARNTPVSAFKQWLAARCVSGTVFVDKGAEEALIQENKSLLPIGASGLEGTVLAGDTVKICRIDGSEIGFGISNFSTQDLEMIQGKKSEEIEGILGCTSPVTVIHRDNLVIQ